MSTIKVQNICETTNFFMNYFLSRTGVTSNRFIIEMLQAVKTYQTKIKKNETWFSLFPYLAFVVIALFASVPCNLEAQFQNEFNRFNRRVAIVFLLFF